MSNELSLNTCFLNNNENNNNQQQHVVESIENDQYLNRTNIQSYSDLPSLNEVSKSIEIDKLIENTYIELIDDVLFGLILQMHRAAKLDYLFYLEPDVDAALDKQFEIFNDHDVIGVFSTLNENFKVSSNKSSF
jgi:hypothetical protein